MGRRITYDDPIPSIFWTDSAATNSTSSPHSFTGVGIGTAEATREVFVATYFGAPTALTVGGVSATLVVNNSVLKLWRATVPTGTTATVTATISAGTRLIISVWSVFNLRSTTPFATASYNAGANATTHTTTINTEEHGILVAAGSMTVAGGSVVTSWSGATLRDNRSLSFAGQGATLSAADKTDTAAATGASLQSVWNASVLANMVAASFR